MVLKLLEYNYEVHVCYICGTLTVALRCNLRVYPILHRVLDIEPDSEDEEAILERRRQLRRAIEEKYQAMKPLEASSKATSPTRSEASADSDLVGLQATE